MSKRKAAKRVRGEMVHTGSDNVFADLGLNNPEEHLAKARLTHTICELIRSAKLTQKQAAIRLGVDQPKVSNLMRGKLRDFSTERLMHFINALDRDVIITIRKPEDAANPRVRVRLRA